MVKKYCEMLGYNQKTLANKLGLSAQTFGKWNERGQIPKSSLIALELLAENERLKRELAEIKSALKILKTLAG